MFAAYTEPIKIAMFIFPFLALLISLPFFVRQYRKYGRFLAIRALVLYSFVFYLLTAYFLAILPLPSREAVAQLTTPRYELVLGKSLHDFLTQTVWRPTDIHTYLPALKQSVTLEPLFNLVFFFPLGVYLRYYFRFSFKKVVLYSFLLSLFFETTQLTGLYFIYPRPYRLFDVNDLFHNTLGGMIGYACAPLIMILFPSRKEMDEKSFALGQVVTYPRRFIAFLLDWGLIYILKTILAIGLHVTHITQTETWTSSYWTYLATIGLYFVGMTYSTKGYTIGKKIVKIRVVGRFEQAPTLRACLIRYGLLYGIYGSLAQVLLVLNPYVPQTEGLALAILLAIILGLLILQGLFIGSIGWAILKKDRRLFYEKKSQTTEISMNKWETK